MKKKATTPAPENGPAEREDSIPVQVSQPRYGVLDIGRPVTEQVAELANASAAPEPGMDGAMTTGHERFLRFLADMPTDSECLESGKDPGDRLANDIIIIGARSLLEGTWAPPRPEPVNARLLAALKAMRAAYPLALTATTEQEDAHGAALLAIAEAEKAAPVVIRLDIDHGVVGDPVGLPPGVQLHVHDIDRNHYDGTEPCDVHPEGGCCVHEFPGE